MPQNKYNTNLASEFFVLSMLHRLGVNCQLTLGNKKSVDIIVQSSKDKIFTIDVKGIAGKTLWPLDNFKTYKKSHFLVLVSFLGKINESKALPEIYVLRSNKVGKYIYRNPKKTRKGIQLSVLRKKGKHLCDNWKPFLV
jgi:hypothetical protein